MLVWRHRETGRAGLVRRRCVTQNGGLLLHCSPHPGLPPSREPGHRETHFNTIPPPVSLFRGRIHVGGAQPHSPCRPHADASRGEGRDDLSIVSLR